jgi:HAD superfamily hydrolase (TIGR01662 family)
MLPMEASHHPRAALFDFDGTLGQSLPHWTSAYGETLQHHGVSWEAEKVIKACLNRSQRDVLEELAIPDHEAFKEGVWRRVKDRMHLVETYPDILETLHELRAHSFAIAVVTNSRKGHVGPVLKRWEIEHHIDALVAIDDVSNGKPHPEPLLHALQLLDIPPSRAWMIGDSLADVHAGAAAGVRTIAFSPTENHPYMPTDILKEANPTRIAHSFREIARILIESD